MQISYMRHKSLALSKEDLKKEEIVLGIEKKHKKSKDKYEFNSNLVNFIKYKKVIDTLLCSFQSINREKIIFFDMKNHAFVILSFLQNCAT